MPYRDQNINRECRRKSALKIKYGITPADYNRLFVKQGGRCAICFKHESEEKHWKRLAIDHDHKSGKVRGLLCVTCNVRIGVLESGEWLAGAEQYLKFYGEPI